MKGKSFENNLNNYFMLKSFLYDKFSFIADNF